MLPGALQPLHQAFDRAQRTVTISAGLADEGIDAAETRRRRRAHGAHLSSSGLAAALDAPAASACATLPCTRPRMRSRSAWASATACTVDAQHAVAAAQPGGARRAAGLDLAQHRLAEGRAQPMRASAGIDLARAQARPSRA
jgi:hypothetical protein